MSSRVEDLFAFFLSLNMTQDFKYLVDQPLNIGKRQFYPDISIVKENRLIHTFDVKTDLGWKRNSFSEFCQQKNNELKDFFNAELSATDGVTKDHFTIQSGNTFAYHIIILSGKNIKTTTLNTHLETVKPLEHVQAYVLYPSNHPNYYGDDFEDFIESVEINENDFDRISKL